MLNISSSLRGIGKKNFFVCSVYSAFLAGREIGKLFFWKAFLTFSLSISERSKIECGDVCTMRENNGFALLYNVCLLVWTARLFPLVKRTKWCQTVTIGDDDSHRARALRKLVFRPLVAWKKVALWISWGLVLIIVMIKLCLHLVPFITGKCIFILFLLRKNIIHFT